MSGGLMEAARASWWHSSFLQAAGAKIGRGVYFDTMSFSVGLHSPASSHTHSRLLASLDAEILTAELHTSTK